MFAGPFSFVSSSFIIFMYVLIKDENLLRGQLEKSKSLQNSMLAAGDEIIKAHVSNCHAQITKL